MRFAFVPIYIKYMGIESYALIGMFALVQSLLGILDMGMTPALCREMARLRGGAHTGQSIRDLLRSIEVIFITLATIVAFSIWLVSDWLATDWLRAETLDRYTIAQALSIMGVVTAVRFIGGVYRSSLMGLQLQVKVNLVEVVFQTLRGIGSVVVLAWVSPTIAAFFAWQGFLSCVELIAFMGITYRELPKASVNRWFSTTAVYEIRNFAGGMLGISMLTLLLMQSDKFLLSRLLSLSDYGYYTLAAAIAGGVYSIGAPILSALSPKLSELVAANNNIETARIFHLGAQLISVAMGSAAAVLVCFSTMFLHLWTQDSELSNNSSRLVSLLTFGNLLNGLMWIPYQTQLAYGWTALTIRVNSLAVIVLVPLLILITPYFGPTGAACVWVGLNAFYVIFAAQLMYQKILASEKWPWYINDLLQPLSTVFLVAFLFSLVASSESSSINQIVFLVVAAFCTFFSGIVSAPIIRDIGVQLIRTQLTFRRSAERV